MQVRRTIEKLLAFNCQVLDQALQVIDLHAVRPDVDFSAQAGPHLRHVIEHYDAFVGQVADRSVDYDARARDVEVERDHIVARARVERVQRQLRGMAGASFEDPIAVHLRGGLDGEENFVTFSTVGRELLFLSSHAVHHYALIRMHCLRDGIALGIDFGKAASTVHHEHQR